MTTQRSPRLYIDDEEIERATRQYMRVDRRQFAKDTLRIALFLLAAVAIMAVVMFGVALLVGMLLRAGNTAVTSAIAVIAAGAGAVLVGYMLGKHGGKRNEH